MIVFGVGCKAEASLAAILALCEVADMRPDLLAVSENRAGLETISALAQALGCPLKTLPLSSLKGVQTPTQSPRILAKFGTGSLAEALALTAAGPQARLLSPRIISSDGSSTLAIAQGASL